MHSNYILLALLVNLIGFGAFALGISSKDEKTFDSQIGICVNVASWACGDYQSLNIFEKIKCLSTHESQIGNLCVFRLLLKEASLDSENECWQALFSSCSLKDENTADSFFNCFRATIQTTGSLERRCTVENNNNNIVEETLVKSKSQARFSKYQTELSNIEGVTSAHHGASIEVDDDDPSSPFNNKKGKKNCRELSDKHADFRLPECEDSSPFHFWDRAFVVGFILGGVAIMIRYIRKENQLKNALLPHRAAASELLSEADRIASGSETASSDQVEDPSPGEEKSKTETIV